MQPREQLCSDLAERPSHVSPMDCRNIGRRRIWTHLAPAASATPGRVDRSAGLLCPKKLYKTLTPQKFKSLKYSHLQLFWKKVLNFSLTVSEKGVFGNMSPF